MELFPDFNQMAHWFLGEQREELTQVFLARLLEGDTYIFLDSKAGEISLMSREELTSRIERLTGRGVTHEQRPITMGEGSVGGT